MADPVSVLTKLKSDIDAGVDISDPFIVGQEIADCLILFKHKKEEVISRFYKLFAACVYAAYPDVVEELDFSTEQHRVASAYVSDFVQGMVQKALDICAKVDEEDMGISRDASVGLFIFAMIISIPQDLRLFFEFEATQWDYDDPDE